MAKILIVEDDTDISTIVSRWLKHENHLVEISKDGEDASVKLKLNQYDLIILDWMLPKVTGVELCQKFRANGGTTPILLLTAKSTIENKETGLDSGADDYLTKPFDLKELSARVRALLRRSGSLTSKILKIGDLSLDAEMHQVTLADNPIVLNPKEFALLEFLMRHPNQIFSGEALLSRVWQSDAMASSDTVRAHIKNLRKKIDQPGKTSPISTVHGLGYKMEA
jgi:DNA-binding response OmpR family regulator